jgi:hypothetical protein
MRFAAFWLACMVSLAIVVAAWVNPRPAQAAPSRTYAQYLYVSTIAEANVYCADPRYTTHVHTVMYDWRNMGQIKGVILERTITR